MKCSLSAVCFAIAGVLAFNGIGGWGMVLVYWAITVMKRFDRFKAFLCITAMLLLLVWSIASGVYLLRDDSCGVDRVSLEKRCQKALSHYRY